MDKQSTKAKNKFLKLLTKASIVNFQNPPYSPGRDNHHNNINSSYNTTHNFFRPKSHLGNHHKSYSGPLVSIIPAEARTRSRSKKNNGTSLNDDHDDTSEPTSPKVSCIGQIKHHHKHSRKHKNKNSFKKANPSSSTDNNNKTVKQFKSKSFSHDMVDDNKSRRNSFKRIFMGKLGKRSSDDIGVGVQVGVSVSPSSNNVDAEMQRGGSAGSGVAPSLGQMKRFSSSRRDGYGSFDWTAQIAPEECEEVEEEEEEEEEEEVRIPFSAPMVLGGGDNEEMDLKPRKEVNLWKRRTMAPPVPLQLQQQRKHS